MVAVGFVLFALCYFLMNFVFNDVYLFDRKKRDYLDAAFGIVLFISFALIVIGIAIKLWEFMP